MTLDVLKIIALIAYVAFAPIAASRICGDDDEPTGFLQLAVVLLATPASLLWLLALGIWSIPDFVIYPERHAHLIDFQGTDEQKAAMMEYRAQIAERSFVRRLVENIGLATYTGPDPPQAVLDFENEYSAKRDRQNPDNG